MREGWNVSNVGVVVETESSPEKMESVVVSFTEKLSVDEIVLGSQMANSFVQIHLV